MDELIPKGNSEQAHNDVCSPLKLSPSIPHYNETEQDSSETTRDNDLLTESAEEDKLQNSCNEKNWEKPLSSPPEPLVTPQILATSADAPQQLESNETQGIINSTWEEAVGFIPVRNPVIDVMSEESINEEITNIHSVVIDVTNPPEDHKKKELSPIGWFPYGLFIFIKEIECAKNKFNLIKFLSYIVKKILNIAEASPFLDVIWVVLSFIMLIFGFKFLFRCPAQTFIPVYLVQAGIFGLLSATGNAIIRFLKKVTGGRSFGVSRMLVRATRVSLYFWFMAGTYFVYTAYPPNYVDSTDKNFCELSLYQFSFVLANACVSLTITFLLILTAGIIYYVVCKVHGNFEFGPQMTAVHRR